MRPWVVVAEGNIGAGKSSMLQELQKHLRAPVQNIAEPINQTLFNMMSTSVVKHERLWANFCFQMCTLMQRSYSFKHATGCGTCSNTVLLDRSVYGDMLFAAVNANFMGWDSQFMNAYDESCGIAGVNPDTPFVNPARYRVLMMYVATDVSQCTRQIEMRGRAGEAALSEKYLRMLDTAHLNMFLYLRNRKTFDVLVLDADSAWTKHKTLQQITATINNGAQSHVVTQFCVHFGMPSSGISASTCVVDWNGAPYPNREHMLSPITPSARDILVNAMINHVDICLVNGVHL